ncbi:MAG TPA: DUF6504 family protein [Streptosporangiaceae bacterium]|nr:DUF6504 family protein [Streptosporangiaceae bacterium]
MRGIRGEPVEVWLRNDRPARFVWRGRLHTVIFVLDRQVTPAAAPADVDSATGDAAAGDAAASDPATTSTASTSTESTSTESTSTESTSTESTNAGGSECWRVEATPARSVPPATYELCRDLASGRWLLSRG